MQYKLLLLAALFCGNAMHAQTTSYEDVVYLKNGSIIHGMIIEQVPNVSIKIKSGVNVFVYKMDEIEKITKEEMHSSGGGTGGDYGFKAKGFAGSYEIGLSDYPKGGNIAMFSIMVVNGYRFNPYFVMGLGVGAEISTKSIFNFPVYADFKATFTKTRVAPFFDFGAGYNASVQKGYDYSYNYYYYYGSYSSGTDVLHGFMISPAFGVRFAANQKVGVSMSIGYKYIGSVVPDYDGNSIVSDHGIMLRWGVIL